MTIDEAGSFILGPNEQHECQTTSHPQHDPTRYATPDTKNPMIGLEPPRQSYPTAVLNNPDAETTSGRADPAFEGVLILLNSSHRAPDNDRRIRHDSTDADLQVRRIGWVRWD